LERVGIVRIRSWVVQHFSKKNSVRLFFDWSGWKSNIFPAPSAG